MNEFVLQALGKGEEYYLRMDRVIVWFKTLSCWRRWSSRGLENLICAGAVSRSGASMLAHAIRQAETKNDSDQST